MFPCLSGPLCSPKSVSDGHFMKIQWAVAIRYSFGDDGFTFNLTLAAYEARDTKHQWLYKEHRVP